MTSFHTFYVKVSPLDEPFSLLGNTYITISLKTKKSGKKIKIVQYFLVSLYRTGKLPY